MNPRRHLLLVLMIATIELLACEKAHAQVEGPTLQLRPNPAGSGQRVSLFGAGFCPKPCTNVTVRLAENVVATVQVSAQGQISAGFEAPFLAGSYAVEATQLRGTTQIEATDSLTVGTNDVNLQGPGPTAGPPLPPTASPAKGARTTTSSPPRATTARPSTTSASSVPSTGAAAPAGTAHDSSSVPWIPLGVLAAIAAGVSAAIVVRRRARAE